jgi:hypothetical protein
LEADDEFAIGFAAPLPAVDLSAAGTVGLVEFWDEAEDF